MDTTDVAWAAGFFDGEGCIHIARNIRVIVSGVFRPGILEAYAAHWGSRVTSSRTSRPNQRQGVRWEITGKKAAAFLRDTLPFLREKREQALLAIQYHEEKLATNVRGGRGYSSEQRKVFAAYEQRLKNMKKICWYQTRISCDQA